ncbi:MAG: BadF/BadG/BcrA/BcrD ATPase family protein, partial [Candidatus Acidiferrales bacterium]
MRIRIGLDIGSTAVKLAAVLERCETSDPVNVLSESSTFHLIREAFEKSCPLIPGAIAVSEYRRSKGNPYQAALDLLREFQVALPGSCRTLIGVTGSGGRRVADALGVPSTNEFKAIARGVSAIYPHVRTIFEMGGENSKYLLLDPPASRNSAEHIGRFEGSAGILDYSMSSQCAAGTGSFIDQQASRLRYRVEDIGEVVMQAHAAARIAGRCSVFAKSDMIHAQQKGYTTAEVLKGLCEAVARNFKSNIVKGRKVLAP